MTVATKYRAKYGQYSSDEALKLSKENIGTVVYSGLTNEIWIDGKCIANAGNSKTGAFKTGHADVFNPDSDAFEDGLATVRGVQEYIEERITWDEFIVSVESLASDITESFESGEGYTVGDDVGLDGILVF